jgi:ABC-2 type transport system ATP-binding protein
MDPLLVIEGLSKRFGPIVAVDDVSFTLRRGEVLGFLGPNGAGKSTTMRMITGYLAPSGGQVTVCGLNLAQEPIEVRKRIGYLPEGAPAYGDMTPLGLLRFAAALRGFAGAERRERIDAVVGLLELESVLQKPVETLSKGFKRRVGLALAQKHHVRTLLQEMAAAKAIIISTHILEEVEALCTRAIVIARGRIVIDARPAELEARSSYHNAVALRLPADQAAQARAVVSGVPGVIRVEQSHADGASAELLAFPAQDADILDPVCRAVERAGLGVNEVFVERGRLDEVFRQLTQAA